MATLGASGSSNTSPRWGRSGEPGSAFSGLSRGRGRGRGGAGGGRGGRGKARGPTTKSEDDIRNTKPDSSQSSPSPSTKSSASGKPNALPTKPKPASRRGSRANAVPVVPQINNSVDVATSTSTPAKLQHKRRRSQAGKPALPVLPKANSLDSPLRSNKFPLSSESHTEPLKDMPPHSNSRLDVRNDIDALVERVRAVAMDNRPCTPRSHIDWAVDDDDTLPDLDDWGVTTTTLTSTQVISPIIVDGLRSLPEFAANSSIPSSLKQIEGVTVQPAIDVQLSSVDGVTLDKVIPPGPPSTRENVEPKSSKKPGAKHDPQPLKPGIDSPNASISLHPSLPAKPIAVDSIVLHDSKARPRASPMRIVSHEQSPITAISDISREPHILSTTGSEQTDAQEPAETQAEITDHQAVTNTPDFRLNTPEHLIIVEPIIVESAILNLSSDGGGPDYTQTAQEPSLPNNPFPNGLGASIHAPKGIVDSVSAPANLSTYTSSRNFAHTHTRAHTVGRSPLPEGQGDYMSRFSRSGHTTPKGGFQGNSHARTHSTPPGGANHYRSPQTSRPVITGDAISRLARTIGKTHNNLSPPKNHSTVTLGD